TARPLSNCELRRESFPCRPSSRLSALRQPPNYQKGRYIIAIMRHAAHFDCRGKIVSKVGLLNRNRYRSAERLLSDHHATALVGQRPSDQSRHLTYGRAG